MTAIEIAIQDAIRGGWRPPFILRRVELEVGFGELFYQMYASVFIDPLFWQALGKSRGWAEEVMPSGRTVADPSRKQSQILTPSYRWYWHRFIDHLIAEKTAEDFFKSL
jgi:hypothetical protein